MRRSLTPTAIFIAAVAWAMPAASKEHIYYTITLEEATVAGSVAKVDSFTVKQGVKPVKVRAQWKFATVMGPSGGFNVDPDASRSAGANRLVVVTRTTGQCQVGKRYPSATMEGGGKRYTLTGVRITGCARSSDDGGIPTETISLNFDKIT